jgi:hypothetical protein
VSVIASDTPRLARSWAWKDCAAAVRPLTRMRGTAPVSKARPRSLPCEGIRRCEEKCPLSPGKICLAHG